MSAFVCSPKHIAVLAQRLLQRFNGEVGVEGEFLTVKDFAANLAVLNLKSVGSRYRLTQAGAAKDFRGTSRVAYIRDCQWLAESEELWKEDYSAARLWGIASSYLYQSCEHNGAEDDVTYKTVQQYETVLEAECRRNRLQRDGWSLE